MLQQSAPPNTVLNSKTTVAAAGTRVVLGAGSCVSVTITAPTTNSGAVYVGNSSVSSANGYQLNPGASISLDISSLSVIFLDTATNGNFVTYIAVNF